MKHAIQRAAIAAAMLGCLGTQAYAGSCPTRDQHGDPCVSAIKNERLPMNDGKDTNFVITYRKNPFRRGAFRVWAETNEGEEKSNGFANDETTLNCTTTLGCSGMRAKFKFECTDNSPDSGSNTPAAVPAKPSQTSTPTPTPSATVPPPQTTLAAPQPSVPSRKFSECLAGAVSCRNSCQQTFGSHGSADADALLACKQSCTSQSNSCLANGNALVDTAAALAAGNTKSNPKETKSKSHQRTSKETESGGSPGNKSALERAIAADRACTAKDVAVGNACSSRYPQFSPGWLMCVRPNAHRCAAEVKELDRLRGH
jgi:hypothetical protein